MADTVRPQRRSDVRSAAALTTASQPKDGDDLKVLNDTSGIGGKGDEDSAARLG